MFYPRQPTRALQSSHTLHNLIIDLHKTKGFAFDDTAENNIMFDSHELQKRFISLWTNIAARYGKNGNVVFEPLNEVSKIDRSR